MALAALVVGISAVVLFFTSILALVIGVVAIVLGAIGVKKASERAVGKGQAVTGIVTGAVAIVLAIGITVVYVVAVSAGVSAIQRSNETVPTSEYTLTGVKCDPYTPRTSSDAAVVGRIRNDSDHRRGFRLVASFRDEYGRQVMSQSSDTSEIGAGESQGFRITAFAYNRAAPVTTCEIGEVKQGFHR